MGRYNWTLRDDQMISNMRKVQCRYSLIWLLCRHVEILYQRPATVIYNAVRLENETIITPDQGYYFPNSHHQGGASTFVLVI